MKGLAVIRTIFGHALYPKALFELGMMVAR
jgi:hypothetical protein